MFLIKVAPIAIIKQEMFEVAPIAIERDWSAASPVVPLASRRALAITSDNSIIFSQSKSIE